MRQLRAEILRFLLAKKKATLEEIQSSLTNLLLEREATEVLQVLLQLEKEQLIWRVKNIWKSI